MKKILILLITTVFLYSSSIPNKETFQSSKYLKEIAFFINKTLPLYVDKETKLINVIGEYKNITYKYILVNYIKEEINFLNLKRILKPYVRQQVCTTAEMKIFPSNGINLNYTYFGNKNKFIGAFSIKPEDCYI